ncbi:hypothetical protein ACFLWN_04280 [Chloroflexota bacterium]
MKELPAELTLGEELDLLEQKLFLNGHELVDGEVEMPTIAVPKLLASVLSE